MFVNLLLVYPAGGPKDPGRGPPAAARRAGRATADRVYDRCRGLLLH